MVRRETVSNKKAQQYYKNTNHVGAQTQSNTEYLEKMGQIILPMSMKIFELEKNIESLNNKLIQSKALAKAADYRSLALQNLSGHDPAVVREAILKLQKVDFLEASDADDKQKNLTVSQGPAEEGQYAIVSGKVFKDGVALENEEIVGSKIELGQDELFKGIDSDIIGMNVNEVKDIKFLVQDQEYQINIQLLGLRDKPVVVEEQSQGSPSEETELN
jgi:hypothetical protein